MERATGAADRRRRVGKALRGRGALVVVACAFAASLLMPAIEVGGGPVYSGLDVLVRGWRGASAGVPSWYANPVFACAFVLAVLERRLTAGIAASIGLILGLSSFFTETLAGLGGVSVPNLTLRAGFYWWLAAQSALAAWSWLPWLVANKQRGA